MSPLLDVKRIPLKKIYLPLIIGSFCFFACKKDASLSSAEIKPCQFQTENPTGRSYSETQIWAVSCFEKHCGLMPLSKKNYWIYEDSVFLNGVFQRVQYDTLRYITTYETPDKLIWWESNLFVGIPAKLYASDSALFEMDNRMFTPGIMDAKKDYWLFPGDSVRYLTSFEDNAATGRSLKLPGTIKTPAGEFDNCLLFEKYARNFRRDQVYFRPGIGVLRYSMEKAPMGSPLIKLQQVSTLVAYYIE